ncbi:hypothetical protein BOTBODRAFT_179348 [Botryobasidium botryosum FD-172 SS1]|uniref:Uncharacterized protein n=1 Tax=Botryobasidium botryosum (strain FD-172 SS1) TaxID=930990 RepID=A0A067MBP2_BOTB1|nr:hypothetical protein BOTBODRAFT_179348 [Botryobasidium botryosum FD-172 SS1]
MTCPQKDGVRAGMRTVGPSSVYRYGWMGSPRFAQLDLALAFSRWGMNELAGGGGMSDATPLTRSRASLTGASWRVASFAAESALVSSSRLRPADAYLSESSAGAILIGTNQKFGSLSAPHTMYLPDADDSTDLTAKSLKIVF